LTFLDKNIELKRIYEFFREFRVFVAPSNATSFEKHNTQNKRKTETSLKHTRS